MAMAHLTAMNFLQLMPLFENVQNFENFENFQTKLELSYYKLFEKAASMAAIVSR